VRETPDQSAITELQTKIIEAGRTNEKALLYEQYLQKLDDKKKKEKELEKNKEDQQKLQDERLEYIKEFKFPFKSLSVDDDGGLLMDGRPLKEPYFSTGQLIRIVPTLFSALNPELRYVFIQDFNLLDDKNKIKVVDYLVNKNFQLMIELVGDEPVAGKNCIVLRNNTIVKTTTGNEVPRLIDRPVDESDFIDIGEE